MKPAILVALVLAAQPVAAQAEDPGSAEALRLVDIWLDSVQAYDKLPALSAAIVEGDATVWARGYGSADVARKVPVTADTIYSICSISKLFTAIALMQQWEARKVRLDEPVTTYLPWAQLKPLEADSMPITLRGLLSHSAGGPREFEFPYWTDPTNPFPTQAELRATMPGQTPLYPASRWFQYSNLGLTLVGETVEAVAGQPFASVAEQQILKPLGLADTRPFMPVELRGKRLATGWGALKRDGTRDVLPPFDTRGVASAAGFTSTANDLARFAAWQFRLLRSEKPEILRASTLRDMQRVQFTDPAFKTTRGLGFVVARRNDQTYVGHSGGCPGYKTTLSLRPETETAVTVLLASAEAPEPYAAAIFGILDKRKGFAFKGNAPATVDLNSYTGRYNAQPWAPETVILPWAGGLALLELPSSDPAADIILLKPTATDRFRVLRADGSESDELTFSRNAAGQVVSFTRFQNPRPRTGPLSLP